MGDLFDKLDKEKKQHVTDYKIDSKLSKCLEEIMKCYETCTSSRRSNYAGVRNCAGSYVAFLSAIKRINYPAEAVTIFTNLLPKVRGDVYDMGLFISALVNNCKESDVTICTRDFEYYIPFIGYMNSKNLNVIGPIGHKCFQYMLNSKVVINGDVDDGLGYRMCNGEIIVNGNCTDCVGQLMEDGCIIVKGNADNDVGYNMSGGSIIVEGNCEDDLAHFMKGGMITIKGNAGDEIGTDCFKGIIMLGGNAGVDVGIKSGKEVKILLNGTCSSISGNLNHSEIYHQDKLVFKDGKPKDPNDFIELRKYRTYVPRWGWEK